MGVKYEVRFGPESQAIVVDVGALDGERVSLEVGGRKLDAEIVRAGGRSSILIDGHVVDPTRTRAVATVTNERLGALAGRGGAGRVEKIVKSPMPGRIVKVYVEKGAHVTAGTPLLVVEAMKMENEVKAKSDGVVAEVHVAVGQAVEANAKLLSLE